MFLIKFTLELLLEILNELYGKGRQCFLVLDLGLPALLGVKQILAESLHCLGHLEVEMFEGVRRGIVQLVIINGIKDQLRVMQADSVTVSVLALSPSTSIYGVPGVDQPDLHLVLLDLVVQHLGVNTRMQRKEDLSEAGRECRFGGFGGRRQISAAHLGCVARQELVIGLLIRQPSHWRQDSLGIAGQEDDIGRMGSNRWDMDILQEIQGESRPGIRSNRDIIEVDFSGMRIEATILDDGPISNGIIDFWFNIFIQVDGLRIAATFDIEDALITPTGLVITDDLPLSRPQAEGSLAGCRQPAHDSRGAILIEGGRCMEGEDVLAGHIILEDLEHGLLHLARELRPQDDHLPLGQVQDRHHVGCQAGQMPGDCHLACIENIDVDSL